MIASAMKSLLLTFLKVGATVALVAYIVHTVGWAAIVDGIMGADPVWLLTAAGLWYAQMAVSVWRWRMVLKSQGDDIGLYPCFNAYYGACLLAIVMPATVGLDACRAKLLKPGTLPFSSSMRAVLKDRLLSIISLVILVVFTLPPLAFAMHDDAVSGAILFGAALFVVAILVALFGEKIWRLVPYLGRHLVMTAAESKEILRNPSSAALMIGLGMLVHVFVAAQFWCLGQAVGFAATYGQHFILLPSLTMLVMLPITISGWGVRETAFYKGFSLMGLTSPLAVTLSVLYGLMATILSLGGAVPLIAMSMAHKIRLKDLTEKA